MTKSNFITAISLTGFIAIAIIAYQFKASFLAPEGTLRAITPSECDLHRTDCTAIFPNGDKVTLSLSPRSLPLLKPIQVKVQLEGFTTTAMQFNIIGLNMDMGINRNTLSTNDQQSFTGEMILPVCANHQMQWEAQVVMSNKDKQTLIAHFQFYTQK